MGGPGALNAGYLNGVKQTARFIRAAGLYDDVLTKALAYGGTALLIGTAGKGWLYDWYNNYFRRINYVR